MNVQQAGICDTLQALPLEPPELKRSDRKCWSLNRSHVSYHNPIQPSTELYTRLMLMVHTSCVCVATGAPMAAAASPPVPACSLTSCLPPPASCLPLLPASHTTCCATVLAMTRGVGWPLLPPLKALAGTAARMLQCPAQMTNFWRTARPLRCGAYSTRHAYQVASPTSSSVSFRYTCQRLAYWHSELRSPFSHICPCSHCSVLKKCRYSCGLGPRK
mmetsp:Transcript_32533/g.82649  ORF Transcript_32533/g.82649 Transcript_32533/m.82649 type:complete len:217 (+) Transcript_32533:239-889(+)